jgi:hypothetical protein
VQQANIIMPTPINMSLISLDGFSQVTPVGAEDGEMVEVGEPRR